MVLWFCVLEKHLLECRLMFSYSLNDGVVDKSSVETRPRKLVCSLSYISVTQAVLKCKSKYKRLLYCRYTESETLCQQIISVTTLLHDGVLLCLTQNCDAVQTVLNVNRKYRKDGRLTKMVERITDFPAETPDNPLLAKPSPVLNKMIWRQPEAQNDNSKMDNWAEKG